MKNIYDQITLNHLIDIYRGSAAKRIAKYQSLPGAGKGKSLSRVDVERLVQTLCTKQVFKEYCVSNKMGFVSSYVKLGPVSRQLEIGQLQIVLTTTEEIAPESNGGKSWPSRKRKSCGDEDLVEEKVQPTKRVTKAAYKKDEKGSSSKSTRKQTEASKEKPMNLECFEKLMDKRSEICRRENIQCHHFLSTSAISEISKAMPRNINELNIIKGVENRQVTRFGELIIDVCNQTR